MVLGFLLIAYVGILVALRIHAKRSMVSSADSDRRAGTTVAIILTAFLFMLMPIIIHHGMNSSDHYHDDLLAKTYNIGMVLAIANSSVNPVIYFLRNDVIRKYVRKLFQRNRTRGSTGAGGSSTGYVRSRTELNIEPEQ